LSTLGTAFFLWTDFHQRLSTFVNHVFVMKDIDT